MRISQDIHWVGVIDWNLRNFHGHTYETRTGTTYNAYLVIDEKVALIDTVFGPFADEMIEKISRIIPLEKIDYIIANHAETDHSGALPKIMGLCPKAKVFCTQKCRDALFRHYYGEWDFQVVKTGDKLKLGKKTLSFIEAAMIHWPDSMFSYLIEDGILFSNDGFAQHYASSERFDDEVNESILMDEAMKYYASILWPFSSIIAKKLDEIQKMNIPIKMIATSHGIIWRRAPQKIIEAYTRWARNEAGPKAVIAYETMWGSTEKMARNITQGIMDEGLSVKVFDVTISSRTDIVKEMLEAGGYIIGSSTHDIDMLPTIAGFMQFLKGLKPKDRVGCAFGSYGWGGGAVREIEEALKKSDIELAQTGLAIRYAPDKTELAKCVEYGRNFAQILKKG